MASLNARDRLTRVHCDAGERGCGCEKKKKHGTHLFLTAIKRALLDSSCHAAFLPLFADTLRKGSIANAARLVEWYALFFAAAAPGADDSIVVPLAPSCQQACNALLLRNSSKQHPHKKLGELAASLGPAVTAAWIASLEKIGADDVGRSAGAFFVGLRCGGGVRTPAQQDCLMKLWKAALVGARTELPIAVHEAFAPLPVDAGQIVPEMSRMLKRSPEVSAHNVAAILGMLPGPLVLECQAPLLGDIVPLLASSRENVRQAGVRICHFLARSASADSVKVLMSTVAGSLTSGAAGKAPEGRMAVIAAIGSIVESSKSDTAALSALVAASAAESSFECKGELLLVLGTYLSRYTPISADVATMFFGVVRDETKPVLIRLQAISALCRAFGNAVTPAAVVDPVVKDFLKLAGICTAVVNNHQLVLPLLYPGVCAKQSDIVRSNAAVWTFLSSANSPLNSASGAFFGRATDLGRELSTQALAGLLGDLGKDEVLGLSDLLRTFCGLIASNSKQVRRLAISCARKVANSSPVLSTAVVQSALTSLVGNDGQKLLPFVSGFEVCPAPNVLLQTVQIFAAPSLEEQALPLLALALHHPSVSLSQSAAASAWHLAVRRSDKVAYAASAAFLADLNALVFSEHGVFSAVQENVAAASSALRSVCAVGGSFAFATVTTALVSAWEKERSQVKLSSRDVAVYRTPEGKLFEEPELDEYVPEQVEARRKNNEEEWADAIRAEIAAKKGLPAADEKAKGNMSKRDAAMRDARERQAMVEGLIRRRVGEIERHSSGILRAALAIATSGVDCGKHLAELFPVVAALIGSPLVGVQAANVASVLAKFSSDALRGGYRCSLPLALARLRTGSVADRENAIWAAAQILGVVLKRGSSLDPGPFAVLFPLVQAAIEFPNSTSLSDAVSIFELQTSRGESTYPRGEMVIALVDVIALNEALGARCAKVACDLGSRFSVSDVCALFVRYPSVSLTAGRDALLKAIAGSPPIRNGTNPEAVRTVAWVARHDPEASLAAIAGQIWTGSGLQEPSSADAAALVDLFVPFLSSDVPWVRVAAAAAMVDVVGRDAVDGVLTAVFALFASESVKESGLLGVAAALTAVAVRLDPQQVLRVINWILGYALVEQVSNEPIRVALTNVGASVIAQAGAQCMDQLWQVLDEANQRFLHEEMEAATDKEAEEKKALQLSCIIFIASLSSHMKTDDPRLLSIVTAIIDSLLVSSESMQPSIAQHLAPLMAMIPEEQVQGYVTRLFKTVETSKERHERRGAAWGMAGLVKGRKLPALKKYDVLKGIEKLLKDKKRAYAREGALNMIECLVQTVGQGFEAYYIFLLQQLLDRYGDGSVEVRAAAEATAKCIMANLSSSGVRLVLGPLLKSLTGSDWRRKKGGVELLGSMAFISPAQLSSCLPSIVPVLTQVLADTHNKVQEAAREALQNIGGVISNPEIKQHVPLVLKSLNDPDAYTEPLLRALLNTQFVHVIDAPSLALLMPAVTRALSFRNHEAKLMAVQIVGNIGSLTKPADLSHYLPNVSEEMRNLLIDPAPEVRATCARAWGNLLRGMGESKFPDLVAWLLNNFEASPLQSTRAGSAQGLGELLASVPQERFDVLFAEILDRTDHVNSGVRQGAMLTIAYLPGPDVSAKRMEAHMDRLFGVVLRGLADETDEVRTASLEAGRALLVRFANSYLDLFVPQLEAGVFSTSWRTRVSSLQLLGELLTLCGAPSAAAVAAVADGGGEGAASNFQEERLAHSLGQDRLDRVLASLYVIRCETNATVKQKALLVWKSAVSNPPRTIKRIMPFLMQIVVQCLGSTNADLRETAGRTLGELVERLADKVIPTVLPALTMNKDTSVASRQGACLGLKYLVSSSQKPQLVLYQDNLTAAVSKSLLDPNESVREAAAEAFSEVFEKCGQKVMNQVLDALLEAAPTTAAAEDSLQRIASIDPDKIVIAVVPKLLQERPVPDWAKRCLGAIAGPAGFHFARQLSVVLPVLALDSQGSDESAKIALAIATSTPEDAMYLLVDTVVDLTRENDPNVIVFALNLIGAFTNQHEHGSMDENVVRFIEIVMNLYLDKRDQVLDAACHSMKLLLDSVVTASEEKFIKAIRSAIQAVRFSQIKQGVEVGSVPGFNRPAGLAPVLNLLRQGVMGAAEIKEISAVTIGEVLRLCSPECIASSAVMQLAPIIRILSEKVEPGVKKAILNTLNVLLELVPALVKPLVPQFQVVFTRSLQDADLAVRDEAALALGRLMSLNPRVDPLVNELCTSILASPSKIRHSMLAALVKVLEHAGSKLSEKGHERVLTCLEQLRDDVSCNADEKTRDLTAQGFGALCTVVPIELLTKLVLSAVAGGKSKEENVKDVNFQTLARIPAALKHGAVLDQFLDPVLSLLAGPVDSLILWKSKNDALFQWALVSIRAYPENVPELMRSIVVSVVATDDREVRVAALKLIKEIAKTPGALSTSLLAVTVPKVLELALDKKSFPVKIASERALMHLLCVKKDSGKNIVIEYVKKCDEAFRKEIQGYITRVLSKLNDSDQEEAE